MEKYLRPSKLLSKNNLKIYLALLLIAVFQCPAAAQSLPGAGNALQFNGTSTYINAGVNNRGVSSRITVEAWIKTRSEAIQFAATKYSNSNFEDRGFQLGTSNGRAIFNGRAGKGIYCESGSSTTYVADGRWHHIAGVCDDNVWRVYVDGTLESSTTYSYTNGNLASTYALSLGSYFVLNNWYFDGDIDEIRVWRTAQTQEQIRANMCRKIAPVPTDLVAYYNFDQTSGLVAIDKGSVPTNGTLSNFNSNSPWHLSGAAIGDASTFAYSADLRTTRLRIAATTGDSAIVSNITTQTDGVQLYAVHQAPSVKPAAGTSAAVYFGVFSRGSTGAYDFRLRSASGLSCSGLYTRPANDGTWGPVTTTSTSTSLLVAQQRYRAEYIQAGTALIAPVVAISGDSVLCQNGNTQLTASASGAQSYRWSNGATTPTISVAQPGTYTVTATFAAGCTSTRSRQVIVRASAPVPAFALGPDTTVCEGTPLLLRAPVGNAYTYLWSDGSTGSTLLARQGGTYTVTVRSGCNAQTASRTLIANLCVPNIITPNKDGRNDAFVVSSYNVGEWSVAIYNRWGKEIYKTERYLNDWGNSAAPGVYYYMLRRNATNSTLKGWVEVVR
ncbi:LamG-like jellyroll fold domain-containing protein [Hymenobacter sp. HD11105]